MQVILPTSNNRAEFGGRLKIVHGLSEAPTMLQAEQSSLVDVLVGLQSLTK
jgi:hypothetical protein